MLEIQTVESHLKKRKIDLNIFTFDEPINDISHENIIQELLIDLTFGNLFEEELMYLDEPIRDILVNYTPLGKSIDLSFKEMYIIELDPWAFIVRKFQLRGVMVIKLWTMDVDIWGRRA